MPGSTSEGKAEAVELLDGLGVLCTARSVLDVGAGRGTWHERLAPLLRASWDAIEVWEEWVERCFLRERYDRVYVDDARTIDLDYLRPSYDLAVFGDVLEHLVYEDAVLTAKRLPARVMLLSIPMAGGIHEFQSEHMHDYGTGEDFNCPYERHLSSWTAQMVRETFNVAAEWVSPNIGVFICAG